MLKLLSSRSLIKKDISKTCFKARLTRVVHSVVKEEEYRTSEYNVVYQLKRINLLAAFNKLKIYQLAAASITIPAAYALEKYDSVLPPGSGNSVAVIGLSATIGLFLFGAIVNNTIGFLYVSDDRKKMKISYMNFFGEREDIEDDIKEWVPLSELPPSKMDFVYIRPRLYNKDLKLRLFTKSGEILDPITMLEVFGEIDPVD